MMGNCFPWSRRKNARNLTVAIFGLDNAGKTVTALGLQGESLDTLAPTVGFSQVEFSFGRYNVTMFDLGGGKNIRGIWKNYYAEIYGFVFVIDSSTKERIQEARDVMVDLLVHKRISGKPFLVLANKQDVEGALDEIDIVDAINLENLVNQQRSPCRIETCAATKGQGKKLDKGIQGGFKWLLETIDMDYEKLKERVDADTAEQKELDEIERKARIERVRKIREERARKEEEERLANGEEKQNSDDEDVTMGGTVNPFQAVDMEALTKKEESMRLEKEKKKKKKRELEESLRSQVDSENGTSVNENISPNQSNTSLQDPNQSNTSLKDNKNNSNGFIDNDDVTEDVIERYSNNSLHSPVKAPRRPSPIPGALGKVSLDDDDEDDDVTLGNSSILPPRRLMPLDGGDPIEPKKKKGKKKKKKVKRNQTVPLVEDEDEPTNQVPPLQGSTSAPLGWATTSESRSNQRSRSLPDSPDENDDSNAAAKRSLAEDLDSNVPTHLKPNADKDDLVY